MYSLLIYYYVAIAFEAINGNPVYYECIDFKDTKCFELKPPYGPYESNKTVRSLTIYCKKGEEKTLSKAWKSILFKLNVSNSSEYELFEGSSYSDVYFMYENHLKSWFHFWPTRISDIALNLFNSTCIGVATDAPYIAHVDHYLFYPWYFIATLIAIVLFYSANRLSKNAALYYSTGISIGVIASFLLLFIVLSRLVPGKKASLVILVSGFSTFVTFIQYIWRTQVLQLLESYYLYVMAYVGTSGLLSFVVLYWYGQPTHVRSLNIMRWSIQMFALGLLYYSIQVREAAIASMVCLIATYNFPFSIFDRFKFAWRLRFPPKRRLLTVDEYEQEADEYTKKSLEALRGYCRSPQCDAWKVVSKLKSPSRFAEFVEGSFHIQENEMSLYESDDFTVPNGEIHAEDESEGESL